MPGPPGQQRLVAPERRGSGLDLLAEGLAVERLQVVRGLERAEALLADRERLDRVLLAAIRHCSAAGEVMRAPRHHVTAPWSAEPTVRAYFASAPWV